MASEAHQTLKEKALQTALSILSSEGLSAVQARRVAQGAGCSVGTLYNLYPKLDDLIIAANASTLERLGAAVERASEDAAGADMETKLKTIALAYFDFARGNRKAWHAIFQHQLANDQFVPDWYRGRQEELFGLVEKILADRISEPELLTTASRALFSSVHGIVSLSLDEKLGVFDDARTRRQITFLIEAAVRGMRA